MAEDVFFCYVATSSVKLLLSVLFTEIIFTLKRVTVCHTRFVSARMSYGQKQITLLYTKKNIFCHQCVILTPNIYLKTYKKHDETVPFWACVVGVDDNSKNTL